MSNDELNLYFMLILKGCCSQDFGGEVNPIFADIVEGQ